MAMKGELTRREFLEKGFLVALGAGFASCTGPQRLADITPAELDEAITSSPTLTLTPTRQPTHTPEVPTPTLKPTLDAEAPPTLTTQGVLTLELEEARCYERLDDNWV
jgi:hypothetical protein